MKMGTIASLCRYDVGSRDTLLVASTAPAFDFSRRIFRAEVTGAEAPEAPVAQRNIDTTYLWFHICSYNGQQVRWTWDPDKAAANRLEHGLSFETAVLVFDDPLHASRADPHPDGDRWHTVGLVGPVFAAGRSYLAGRF